MKLDLSVLLPTYNRAAELRLTLERMAAARRDGLTLEVVVIDNNSDDGTRDVVESLRSRLPIRYLFESRPGKSRALNKALDEAPLGDLVAFTDDDVDADPEWFQAIAAASARWPGHSVFGGRVDLLWPDGPVPAWARDPYIRGIGFSEHDLGGDERVYPGGVPVGPNFWLRRAMLECGRRFDEAIGPIPGRQTLGEETRLLLDLRQEGFLPVYVPGAGVRHRVRRSMLSIRGIRRRAGEYGRGMPHFLGLPRRELLHRRPWAWKTLRVLSLSRALLRLGLASVPPVGEERVLAGLLRRRDVAYNLEALRLARDPGWGEAASRRIDVASGGRE